MKISLIVFSIFSVFNIASSMAGDSRTIGDLAGHVQGEHLVYKIQKSWVDRMSSEYVPLYIGKKQTKNGSIRCSSPQGDDLPKAINTKNKEGWRVSVRGHSFTKGNYYWLSEIRDDSAYEHAGDTSVLLTFELVKPDASDDYKEIPKGQKFYVRCDGQSGQDIRNIKLSEAMSLLSEKVK